MDISNNPRWFVCSLLFICFSLNSHVSSAADTISANQSLSGNQTIVSAGEDFVLGFFKPGNSSYYYIGMWYNKVSEQTVVWVANRDKPVSDKYSSVLRISEGNLVLFNESKTPIWSTNVSSTTSSSVEAVLLDKGNLVLREGSNNLTEPLWQSFDHPAHTWLPGMKIGFNKRTNSNQLLTSWKNKENPAPGLFSLELDPTNGSNQYIIKWNRSERYWSSGSWDEHIFSLVPEMRLNYIYNFSYINNENESYFIYTVKDSTISRFIMDLSGQIKQLNWLASNSWFLFWSQPRQQCEVYGFCGAFGRCNEKALPFCDCIQGFKPKSVHDWNLEDYTGGCERRTQLKCGNNSLANEKSDGFLESPNIVLPKHQESVAVGSIKDCETTCFNNCSCTAYAYENNECSIWVGDILNLQQLVEGDSNGKTIYIKLAVSEFSTSKDSKGIIIGVVVGSMAFVVFLGLVLFVYLRRKRTIKTSKSVEGSLMAFTYRDLQNATKNFSEKLGGGGFGSVFKGVLSDSRVIAVKKLESINQGEKQFRTEVSTIGNIQHVNLVQLLGFCSEGTKKLLVYDYMPNGSLESHLFHEKDSRFLDWKTRYTIALGTARGLVYLHEKCRDCIIHCDIKPENILLDAEFCPKVADFGLAKLVGREFSRVLTTMRGTRGYLAPEWISGVAITAKADVYSYGMMLFEFVSGRRNSEQSEDGTVKFFPTWAAKQITEGDDLVSLLDPRLEGDADVEELSRICKVACWCIQDDETHRPSMSQVVQILEGIVDVSQPPVPRSLQIFVDNQEHIIFFTESSSGQTSQTRSRTSAASSQSGIFVLGFFKPGNSSNYYIGIWYKVVSKKTVVWVANRDKPVSDKYSSVLRISEGNLVLFNESKTPIWSTNVSSTTSSSVEAVLLDEGNLVLREGSSNLTGPLWQSFDHPGHTWLPGMKLGFNKRTNLSQLLTSWNNKEDPAPGLFSLSLDPTNGSNQYFISRNRSGSERYWSSGPWNGEIFSLVPEMNYDYIYNFSYVDNDNESYFVYTVKDSTISRFFLDFNGQVKQANWLDDPKSWFMFWSQPRQQCEVYGFCGAFGRCNEKALPFCDCIQGFKPKSLHEWNLEDYTGGCERSTQLKCGNNSLANEKSDRFLESPNIALPKHQESVAVGSIKDCETTCFNNCSCTAYAYENNECLIWVGDILNLQQLIEGDSDGKTIYIKLAASEFSTSKDNKGIIIGVVVGSMAFVVFLGLVLFVYLRRKRTIKTSKSVEGSLMAFTYRDLQNATKNFSEKLGGGGFGSVFKGVLSDSRVIAVKKLESISQGEKQFRTEVSTIGNIQHVNIVRLLGFCSEGTKKLLVYDYMLNGSLDSLLFHEKDLKFLDWKTRYKIALGIARGLAYLHEKCRDRIIHCDIKPENILLDAEFCPKVADFGLAKLVGREFSRVLTTMRGTRGYLAPEWISGVAITSKADVYSYGMMLFEIVSGRRNSEQSEDGTVKFFPTWAAKHITEGGDLISLLDPRLEGDADVEELSRICKAACWCIQDVEAHRPSMGQVVGILEGIVDVTHTPVPRSLQLLINNQEHIIFFTESSSSQSSQTQNNTSATSSHE